jgi:hypothetical protein
LFKVKAGGRDTCTLPGHEVGRLDGDDPTAVARRPQAGQAKLDALRAHAKAEAQRLWTRMAQL